MAFALKIACLLLSFLKQEGKKYGFFSYKATKFVDFLYVKWYNNVKKEREADMNKTLQDNVKDFVEDVMIEYDVDQDSSITDNDLFVSSVCSALKKLIGEYTTYKYKFNLAMGYFTQMAHDRMEEVLKSILADADYKDSEKMDLYFTAFYILSIIFKKSKKNDELGALSDAQYRRIFRKHPLYHEVLSRCYKRENEFVRALDEDDRAIDKIAMLDPDEMNAGPRISYASTVCEMLRENHPELEAYHIEKAAQFIDEAIKCNEKYEKYPFVKAQFIFLSQYRKGGDPALLIEAQQTAISYIEQARQLERRNYDNPHYSVNYENFKHYMAEKINELRYPKSFAQLDLLKAEILEAASHKVCSSSDILPPNPNLKKGDKYFFICYSSLDFKTVYCDLIELYKRKVHFAYDRRLDNDVNWEMQVEEKINDEDCVGVVFYISRNILSGNAVQKEIKIVMDSGKTRFRLNLEAKEPSKMLADYIIQRYEQHPDNYYVDGEKMRLFLSCFNDSGVFADKLSEEGDSGVRHMSSYVDALIGKFSSDIIGD